MSYNGWKNWETWQVNLWSDNSEGIYRDRVARQKRDAWTAAGVEAFTREYFPEGTPDMATEGGEACYFAVDWQEIADAWNDDKYA